MVRALAVLTPREVRTVTVAVFQVHLDVRVEMGVTAETALEDRRESRVLLVLPGLRVRLERRDPLDLRESKGLQDRKGLPDLRVQPELRDPPGLRDHPEFSITLTSTLWKH